MLTPCFLVEGDPIWESFKLFKFCCYYLWYIWCVCPVTHICVCVCILWPTYVFVCVCPETHMYMVYVSYDPHMYGVCVSCDPHMYGVCMSCDSHVHGVCPVTHICMAIKREFSGVLSSLLLWVLGVERRSSGLHAKLLEQLS